MLESVNVEIKKKRQTIGDSICPYFAMFPIEIPNKIIDEYSKEGDLILDPFGGRGTTLQSSIIKSRLCITSDINPLAYIIMKSKVQNFSMNLVNKRIEELRTEYLNSNTLMDEDKKILSIYYEYKTLKMLYFFRNKFKDFKNISEIDSYIFAALLGIMHGPSSKSRTSQTFLSLSMSNTFSMSPNYVKKYAKNNNLKKMYVNVFDALIRRVESTIRTRTYTGDPKKHKVLLQDAKALNEIKDNTVDLIVTSPPYLNIVNYWKTSWIRTWMFGEKYSNIKRNKLIDDNHNKENYLNFINTFLKSASRKIKIDGIISLVVGNVSSKNNSENFKLSDYVDKILLDTNLMCFKKEINYIEQNWKTTRSLNTKQGHSTKFDEILYFRKR